MKGSLLPKRQSTITSTSTMPHTPHQSQHMFAQPVHSRTTSFLNPVKPPSYFIGEARQRYLSKQQAVQSQPKPIRTRRSVAIKPDLAVPVEDLESVYPGWLSKRADFRQTLSVLNQARVPNLPKIVSEASRSTSDSQVLFEWVSSIDYFRPLPTATVREVCERLTLRKFVAGEALMVEGEPATSMFIIYSGTVANYKDGQQLTSVSTRNTLGELALETNQPRSATCVAETPVEAFELTKFHYHTALLELKQQDKHEATSLLMSLPLFRKWPSLKVQRLSSCLLSKTYQAGSMLYDFGDPSTTFYFLKEGQVDLQMYSKTLDSNKWPLTKHAWTVREIHRKFLVTVQTFTTGSFFGGAELIPDSVRDTRAVARTESTCLIINRRELLNILNAQDVKELATAMQLPSQERLQLQLLREKDQENAEARAWQQCTGTKRPAPCRTHRRHLRSELVGTHSKVYTLEQTK